MTDHTSAVIEAQVDYLTVSAHAEERSLRLDEYGNYLIDCQEALGNQRQGWRTMGYEGQHCGQIDWGRRDDRQSILRLSGQSAADHMAAALAVSDYVSRFDLAVTWRAVPADPHLGENAYSNAEMFYKTHPRSARPELKKDADGGFTCYLGDRRSPYYARIYNKEAERASRIDDKLASHYAGCWRYEVEAHDQRAIALSTMVADRNGSPPAIQEWLYQWFNTRGIPTMFPETGADCLVAGFHRRTDDETRLRHLARNVAPTLKRLDAHGRGQEAREALGLDSSNLLLTELERLLKS